MSESDKLANRFHLAYKDMEDVKRYLNAIQELQDLKYVKRTSEFLIIVRLFSWRQWLRIAVRLNHLIRTEMLVRN